jgi:protein phosphatase
MRNILTRALGIKAKVAVDLSDMTLTSGDNILLCSGGLTSMVSDDEILSIATLIQNPTEACNRLVERAKKNVVVKII